MICVGFRIHGGRFDGCVDRTLPWGIFMAERSSARVQLAPFAHDVGHGFSLWEW